MSFNFTWPTFSPQFHQDAAQMLHSALNRGPKPKVIADDIHVEEICMGKVPPELEILEIGDLSTDRFRGIFRLTYAGDAHLTLSTKVQANPLTRPGTDLHSTAAQDGLGVGGLGSIGSGVLAPPSRGILFAAAPLVVPMRLRLSSMRLRAIVVLVISRQKGITLVFKNDPLESVEVSSTFDSVAVIAKYLQQEIEGQLREMFREDLPGIIHRLSQRWLAGSASGGTQGFGGSGAAVAGARPHARTSMSSGSRNAHEGLGPASAGAAGLSRSTSEAHVRKAASIGAGPSLGVATGVEQGGSSRRKSSVTTGGGRASSAVAGPSSNRMSHSPPKGSPKMSGARQRRHSKAASTTGVPGGAGSSRARPPLGSSPTDAWPNLTTSSSPLDEITSYDPTYGLRPDEVRIDGTSSFSGLGSLVRGRVGGLRDLMGVGGDEGHGHEAIGSFASANSPRARVSRKLDDSDVDVDAEVASDLEDRRHRSPRSTRDPELAGMFPLQMDAPGDSEDATDGEASESEASGNLSVEGDVEGDASDGTPARLGRGRQRLSESEGSGEGSEALDPHQAPPPHVGNAGHDDAEDSEEDPNLAALGISRIGLSLDLDGRATHRGRSSSTAPHGTTRGARHASLSRRANAASPPRRKPKPPSSVRSAPVASAPGPDYETIPAVGGGVIHRPRTYHVASKVRAPEPELDLDGADVDDAEGSMTVRRGAGGASRSQSGRTAGGVSSSRTFTVRGGAGSGGGGGSSMREGPSSTTPSPWEDPDPDVVERSYSSEFAQGGGSGESSGGRQSRSAASLATLEPEAMDPRSRAYKEHLYRQRYGGLYRAGYGSTESELESSAGSGTGTSGGLWSAGGLGASGGHAAVALGAYRGLPPAFSTSQSTAPTSYHASTRGSYPSIAGEDALAAARLSKAWTAGVGTSALALRALERGAATSSAGASDRSGSLGSPVRRTAAARTRSAPASEAGSTTSAPKPVVANRKRTFRVGGGGGASKANAATATATASPSGGDVAEDGNGAATIRDGRPRPSRASSSATSWSRGDTASEASSWEALQRARRRQKEELLFRQAQVDAAAAAADAQTAIDGRRLKASRRVSANGRAWMPPDTIRE